MNFGHIFKEARNRKGWTQTELAEKVGLKPSAISHFESNRRKPSFKNFLKLLEVLPISMDSLFKEIK